MDSGHTEAVDSATRIESAAATGYRLTSNRAAGDTVTKSPTSRRLRADWLRLGRRRMDLRRLADLGWLGDLEWLVDLRRLDDLHWLGTDRRSIDRLGVSRTAARRGSVLGRRRVVPG